MSRQTFVDSSAYYAMTDRKDRNAERAGEIARLLVRERWSLFTSNFILAETHSLLLSHLGREVAGRAVPAFRDSAATQVIRVTEADE
ncbi:MAG: hypothetical protein ACR2PL_18835 [Dehalococcoidia bacterium]